MTGQSIVPMLHEHARHQELYWPLAINNYKDGLQLGRVLKPVYPLLYLE